MPCNHVVVEKIHDDDIDCYQIGDLFPIDFYIVFLFYYYYYDYDYFLGAENKCRCNIGARVQLVDESKINDKSQPQ